MLVKVLGLAQPDGKKVTAASKQKGWVNALGFQGAGILVPHSSHPLAGVPMAQSGRLGRKARGRSGHRTHLNWGTRGPSTCGPGEPTFVQKTCRLPHAPRKKPSTKPRVAAAVQAEGRGARSRQTLRTAQQRAVTACGRG